MKTQNLNKGQYMLKKTSISVIASMAIVGTLGFSGCGSDSSSALVTSSTAVTQPQVEETSIVPTTSTTTSRVGTSVIEGTVALDMTATDRTVKSAVSATSEIVAYNLDDNTEYTTTSDTSGEYILSGLTEGSYQVVATSSVTSLRSVRNVEVTRDTRIVVDVVLQAAGSIQGTLSGYYEDMTDMIVYIPGTSYMSTVDYSGNFELINVPIGEVTLFVKSAMGDIYTTNVSVTAGEVTTLPSVNPFATTVLSAYDLASNSTLELKEVGIKVRTNNSMSVESMAAITTLVNSVGEEVAVTVSPVYDWEDYDINYFAISSTDLLAAGEYTLIINTDEVYEKTITVQKKIAVFGDTYVDSGFYHRNLAIAFTGAVPADLNASDITVTGDDNSTISVTLENASDLNTILLLGDFKLGVAYSVALTGTLADEYPDGLFYVGQYDNISTSNITMYGARISSLYPYNGQDNVSLLNSIGFYIYEAESIDLSTVKATFNGKEYTLENKGLITDPYVNSYRSFSFAVEGLNYATEYNLSIVASDVLGSEISSSSTFTTLTPETVGMLPYPTEYADEIFNNLNLEAPLQAFFNVPVDETSGVITLHDDTNAKDVATSRYNDYNNYVPYINDISTDHSVSFVPEEMLPNTTYTMTVSGFKANEYTLADTTTTFTTPSRQLMYSSVQNSSYIDSRYADNRVSFFFYGKLTDTEKAEIVANLDITSFRLALPEDKSHPAPLALWATDSMYGETLYISFTIDPDTSYELTFAGTTASSLGMTSSSLTFMTYGEDNTATSATLIPVNVIDSIYAYREVTNPTVGYNDGNLSALEYVGRGSVNLRLPVVKLDYYDSYACSNIENNTTEIDTWLSGTDLNITSSSSYVSSSPQYHSSQYIDGSYISSYYSCDVTYNASYTMSEDINNSVIVSVPVNVIGGGFIADSLVETTNIPAVNAMDYTVYSYGSEIGIDFNSYVLDTNFTVTTNPADLHSYTDSYSSAFDENGSAYFKNVQFMFDSSNYSIFGYTISGTLSYYDIATHTIKTDAIDLNVSGVNLVQADLEPLTFGEVYATEPSIIAIEMSSSVDTDSVVVEDENGTVIATSFELTDENNDTISIVSAYNYTDYNYDTNSYESTLRLGLASDLNSSLSYTLVQTEDIKKENSTQTLDAGSINVDVVIPQ